jgi:putative acetyltransferase
MEQIEIADGLKIREATNDDCEKIKSLVFGVLREFGLVPEPEGLDSDLNNIETSYFKRGGYFEVIVDDENNVLGSVGIYPVDLHTCELRKMYFAPSIRGKGFGKKLLERTLKHAKFFGFTKITLETASVLKAAISLYESFGFRKYEHEYHATRSDQSYFLEL